MERLSKKMLNFAPSFPRQGVITSRKAMKLFEGEPLYLTNLLQKGRLATNYVCGKSGGVRFER